MDIENKNLSLIQKLEQRKNALERRLNIAQTRLKNEERKKDTRRKILVGAMLLAKAQEDLEAQSALIRQLDSYLTTQRDRELFGL
jgi:hypothetical protein